MTKFHFMIIFRSRCAYMTSILRELIPFILTIYSDNMCIYGPSTVVRDVQIQCVLNFF
jgi:hypothetical protein